MINFAQREKCSAKSTRPLAHVVPIQRPRKRKPRQKLYKWSSLKIGEEMDGIAQIARWMVSQIKGAVAESLAACLTESFYILEPMIYTEQFN